MEGRGHQLDLPPAPVMTGFPANGKPRDMETTLKVAGFPHARG